MSFQSYKEKDKTVCVGKCCVNIQSLFTRLRPNASTGLKQFMELVLAFLKKKKKKKKSPELTHLTFDADPDKGADPGILTYFKYFNSICHWIRSD